MNLIAAFWPPGRRRAAAAGADPLPAAGEPEGANANGDAGEDAGADAELEGSCGWFDSSWILSTGLQVTEHEGVHALGRDVPHGWRLAWLAGAGCAGGAGGDVGRAAA